MIYNLYQISGKEIFNEHFTRVEGAIEVPSMVFPNNKIGLYVWRLTLLRHTDIYNQSNLIFSTLIFEKRSIFGELMVSKLENQSLTDFQVDVIKNDNDKMYSREIRRNIFGKPTDFNKDRVYYFTTLLIEQTVKDVLYEKIKTDGSDVIQILCSVLDNNNDIHQIIRLPWCDYIKHKDTHHISHNDIIDYNAAARVKDVEIQVKQLDTRVGKLEEKIMITEQQISNLNNSFLQLKISQEDSKAIIGKITASLEQTSSFETLDSLSPYQSSLYNSVKWQLNCVYTAATAVQTDILNSSKVGAVGIVGNALQAISCHIPMVGAGVDFFGLILNMVDKHNQKQMVYNFATLVNGPVEMDELSTKVAIGIATSQLDEEKLSDPKTIWNKCIKAVKSATDPDTLIKRIENLFANKVVNVLSDEQREEQLQVEVARRHANIIASMLINKIYSGENIKQLDKSNNINSLLDYIKQELKPKISKANDLTTETDHIPELTGKNNLTSRLPTISSTDSPTGHIKISADPSRCDIRSEAEELAASVLARVKLLLKINQSSINDEEMEKEFVFEFSKLFVVRHSLLVESASRNNYLKTDIINKLANEFRKTKKIYELDSKLFIQEDLRYDSDEFFNTVIETVIDMLKHNSYVKA